MDARACDDDVDPSWLDEVAADVRWSADHPGGLRVEAQLDPDLTWHVEARARFGTLRLDWSQGPLEPEPDGHILVELRPPEGAFLHPLAADYVTTVGTRLVGSRDGVRRVVYRAPVAYLAWPDGSDDPHVVWDQDMMETYAPRGVTSPTVRAALGDIDAAVVAPPLWRSAPPDDTDGAPVRE